MGKIFDAVGTVVGTVIATAVALVVVAVAASLGALVGGLVGEFTWGNHKSPPLNGLVLGAVIGGAIVAVPMISMFIVEPLRSASSKRRFQEQERLRTINEAIAAQTDRRERAAASIVSNSRVAVDKFRVMPLRLADAQTQAARAVACYHDGAFSPFWSAIESAYGSLAQYRDSAATIEDCARKHPDLVQEFANAGGNPLSVAEFPVKLDVGPVEATLRQATADLGKTVYEAQKQPTFAQIWEQRRTTAAVVAGFANLETAVSSMGRALSSAISSLGMSLEGSNLRMETLIRDSAVASAHMVSAQQDQVKEMRSLAAKAGEIKAEIYHQTWGHYPLFG